MRAGKPRRIVPHSLQCERYGFSGTTRHAGLSSLQEAGRVDREQAGIEMRRMPTRLSDSG
jgi:hypothetical protein